MANGTIAFDTLTTSDSVNTGTEKSIDTSYIFNGVAKQWANLNGSGTVAVTDSFNNTSMTDNGTGNYSTTITNNMNNSTYAVPTGGAYDEDNTSAYALQGAASLGKSTSSYTIHCGSNTTSAMDWEYVVGCILGEIA